MIGYRMWLLRFYTKEGVVRLASPVGSAPGNTVWVKEMKAICDQGRLIEHLKAGVHGCGVWSLKSLAQAKAIEAEHVQEVAAMVGTIFNYGTVLEATGGYRSSNAIIWQLFWPDWRCRVHLEREATGLKTLGVATRSSPMYPLCSRECTPKWAEGEIWGKGIFIDKQQVLDMLSSYYQVPILRA